MNERAFHNNQSSDQECLYTAFLDSHPIINELEAIHRILFIAKHVGDRINIAHCGIAEGVDSVDQAKKEGQPVTVETIIYYLIRDSSIFETVGVFAKLSPALRDPKKGSAMIGADADFAIFDLKKEREVKVEEQIQLEYSLYEGMKAVYPDVVLVRGKAVVDDGQIVGKAGYGEYCTPQKAAKQ